MKRTDWQTESNCEWFKVWQTEVDSQAERKKDRKRKKESGHRDRQEESLLATKVPEHFTSRQNHNLLQVDKKSGGKNSTQILGERRQKKGWKGRTTCSLENKIELKYQMHQIFLAFQEFRRFKLSEIKLFSTQQTAVRSLGIV